MAIDAACLRAASEAAGGRLSEAEIRAAAERAESIRKRIIAEGKLDGLNDRLRDAVAEDGRKVRDAGRQLRRAAAMNALVRDRLSSRLDAFMKADMSPSEAFLAILEGTHKQVEGGAVSVDATKITWQGRFVGEMVADLDANVGPLQRLVDDRKLNDNIAREMSELREGGSPGVTGDKMAEAAANVLATHLERSRVAINKLGGYVGKLDGYVPQSHDIIRLLRAFPGKLADAAGQWADHITPLLDLQRSFPDATAGEVREILTDIFKEIVTGKARGLSAAETGKITGPSSLAKSVSRSRTLHFASVEMRNAYDADFGLGNVFQQVIAHQDSMASAAAQMEHFGPNPEMMAKSLLESLRRRINDEGQLTGEASRRESARLSIDATGIGSPVANAWAEMTGASRNVDSMSIAAIGSAVRNGQSMAKLGGMIFTTLPTDAAHVGWAASMRGGSTVRTIAKQIAFLGAGRPKGERAQMFYRLGVGFNSALGRAMQGRLAIDGLPGRVSRATENFFRWTGQGWADDMQRMGAVNVITGELAERAAHAFDDLPQRFRSTLLQNGITAEKWEAIRSVSAEAGGDRYITPDLIAHVSDDMLEPLIAKRLDDVRASAFKPRTSTRADGTVVAAKVDMEAGSAKVATARARLLADARDELEMDLRRYVAEETRNSILAVSARSRRMLFQGTRPGTWWGEGARMFWLFRSFTIEAMQRDFSRAWNAAEPGKEWAMRSRNMATLAATMGVAGYIAMTLKDAAKGNWPPRDPSDIRVVLAALVQGGGAGIAGDFLFGQTNRYGGGALQTLVGPAFGTAGDLITLWQSTVGRATDGEFTAKDTDRTAADALNQILNNTPYANLFWTRPALEIAILNPIREWLSPGYLQRQRAKLASDYGQRRWMPQTVGQML